MQLEKLGDVVRSYPWKCIECKNCEVCQEKGDDVSRRWPQTLPIDLTECAAGAHPFLRLL